MHASILLYVYVCVFSVLLGFVSYRAPLPPPPTHKKIHTNSRTNTHKITQDYLAHCHGDLRRGVRRLFLPLPSPSIGGAAAADDEEEEDWGEGGVVDVVRVYTAAAASSSAETIVGAPWPEGLLRLLRDQCEVSCVFPPPLFLVIL